ncbi:MAG: hypothetical protein Kow0032_26870 [Methyloligellaceae bacterium]
MLANVGPRERTIRLTLGALLVMLAVLFPQKADWGWLGLFPLLSGSARYCPFYALAGYSSCNGLRRQGKGFGG